MDLDWCWLLFDGFGESLTPNSIKNNTTKFKPTTQTPHSNSHLVHIERFCNLLSVPRPHHFEYISSCPHQPVVCACRTTIACPLRPHCKHRMCGPRRLGTNKYTRCVVVVALFASHTLAATIPTPHRITTPLTRQRRRRTKNNRNKPLLKCGQPRGRKNKARRLNKVVTLRVNCFGD